MAELRGAGQGLLGDFTGSWKPTLPSLPKETTPEQIDEHQMALAQLIAHARSKARSGDIFTKETRALFRRYLARVFAGREGAELKASIMDENPGRIRLHVNARYPASVPVVDGAAAGAAGAAEAPRGARVSLHRRRLDPSSTSTRTSIVDLIENAIPEVERTSASCAAAVAIGIAGTARCVPCRSLRASGSDCPVARQLRRRPRSPRPSRRVDRSRTARDR